MQYPPGLKHSYFGINVGYINYPFSASQLEPGYIVSSITVPHVGVRLVLYGAKLTKNLSARITYMRPVQWVKYHNLNGTGSSHSVWMNIAGLTLNGEFPMGEKFGFSAEAGLGIITRNGFEDSGHPVVKNACYGTGLFGGALHYYLNKKWDFQLSTAWSPKNDAVKQPHTIFAGLGFNYRLEPIGEEKIKKNADKARFFPRQWVAIGYSLPGLGYGANNFVSKGVIPVFWGGTVHIHQGLTVMYQRNIYHGPKAFSFDWSIHAGYWTTRNLSDHFLTVSLNPIFRFTWVRTKLADLFFEYSVAGPTFISKIVLDGFETGRSFTFHDFMGIGTIAGKKRNVYGGLRIAHYSNGNIFPQNEGLMIPLSFQLGYSF
jgi:hypothetical protein